jgi:hypothetical protein
LAVDRKVRGYDFVKVKIGDLVIGDQIRGRVNFVLIKEKSDRPYLRWF